MSDQQTRLLYFAYGSNLHPVRLGARIPSRRLMGLAQLQGYQLAFHKRGADLSAKCNVVRCPDQSESLPGALFSIEASEKTVLDEIEGAGYVVCEVMVDLNGVQHPAFMYVAAAEYIDDALRPYQWYKDFVMLGARFLSFPKHYLQLIDSVDAIVDGNTERQARNEQLLTLMRRKF